jgi:hypothetical protein
MIWEEEFGPNYRVPERVELLVRQGLLAETSWHRDVAPSFAARLPSKEWIRLWVEHPDKRLRRSGGRRFAVDRTLDLSKPGELLKESDSVDEIIGFLVRRLEKEGVRARFRLAGPEKQAETFRWGNMEFRAESLGPPYVETDAWGGKWTWRDFAVEIRSPGLDHVRVLRRQLHPDADLHQAAEETMISLVHALSDPETFVRNAARTAHESETGKAAAEAEKTVAVARRFGNRVFRARRDWLRKKGLTPDFETGPVDWLPEPRD